MKALTVLNRFRHVGRWQAMRTGHKIIAKLEAEYAQLIGDEGFETMCQAMQALPNAPTSRKTAADGEIGAQ